ncbi:thioredoxin [uncultured Bacteroides sp.]|uniref:thioredoxin n=1 Tax=uncultured Bacteroides sp. TaxID=162156 RepID=UPI002AAA7DCD|nr:thioredoxin [uncultured Bacteroides sp.]
MKRILLLVALLMAGIITYTFAYSQGDEKNKPEKGVVIQMNGDLFLKDITDYNNIKEWKFKGDKPVVIDFYADWCGPCRLVAPLMKELAKEYEDKIIIYRVNVDNEKELATALNIQSLPTILFIPRKGEPQAIIGSASKDTFKQAIEEVLLKKPAK